MPREKLNLFSLGWKDPVQLYMMGYLRELFLDGGRNLIFKGNDIMIASNTDNAQLYFLDSREEMRPVRSPLSQAKAVELKKDFKRWHFGGRPSYKDITSTGSTMVRTEHEVPPDGYVDVIGPCKRIDYYSKKKDLHDNQSGDAEYKHPFSLPYPILCKHPKTSQLYLVLGNYWIDPSRGIIS